MQRAPTELHCHLWTVWSHHIFPHFLKNGVILEKVIENKAWVPTFPTKFSWKFSHSKNKSARYYYKCTHVFMWRMLYPCHVLIKFIFFDRFSKNPEIPNFMKIRPVGTKLFHADRQTERQTDSRHDKTNSSFSSFMNFSEKRTSIYLLHIKHMYFLLRISAVYCCKQIINLLCESELINTFFWAKWKIL
jgi:hypothetical protein